VGLQRSRQVLMVWFLVMLLRKPSNSNPKNKSWSIECVLNEIHGCHVRSSNGVSNRFTRAVSRIFTRVDGMRYLSALELRLFTLNCVLPFPHDPM